MTLQIFVPFWGDPDLLFAAIDSVRAQRSPDWELTIIDDCYPDASVGERLRAEPDPRITYLRNETNLGITENYREAIRRASGSYITILGCDDLLHPNYVDVISDVIERHPDVDVIQPGAEVIDEHGKVIRPLADRVKRGVLTPRGGETVLTGEQMATSLLRGDWLYWPSLTFRTETLQRIDFREGLPIIQDLALLIDIAFDGGSLVYTPTLAFSYRRHGSSASQKTLMDGRRFRDEREYYRTARELATDRGWRRTARVARVRLMGRLHAVTELPGVLRHGDRAGLKSTLAHIFAV
ncbi:glycosyltransferase [Microbacterium murale]|uniref:Glycosyltransferase involved in cell wall biosynthesis n=1 Tax=Microbacterium murale TaxID=1081040 RepID=A0ABU0PCK8_9MICO|nr:glycosyltransferase [Microbacterium murale]MDQ0645055.1 glycosyltransferase involved in cell wall biosynthesis [Microbacterium murale]